MTIFILLQFSPPKCLDATQYRRPAFLHRNQLYKFSCTGSFLRNTVSSLTLFTIIQVTLGSNSFCFEELSFCRFGILVSYEDGALECFSNFLDNVIEPISSMALRRQFSLLIFLIGGEKP